jgi:hypothetical protein
MFKYRKCTLEWKARVKLYLKEFLKDGFIEEKVCLSAVIKKQGIKINFKANHGNKKEKSLITFIRFPFAINLFSPKKKSPQATHFVIYHTKIDKQNLAIKSHQTRHSLIKLEILHPFCCV